MPSVVNLCAAWAPIRSTSRTNNGLPSVTRNTSAASGPSGWLDETQSATASFVSRGSDRTSPSRPIFAINSAISGDNRGSTSREVPRTKRGTVPTWRARNSSRSNDGTSAEWRSSRHTSKGRSPAVTVNARVAASNS